MTAREVYEKNVRPLPPEEQRKMLELIQKGLERAEPPPPRRSMLELVESFPPGPRAFATWEEYEQALEDERNAWDR